MPLFTIFTPTYNRAHTIHRVYESLAKQSFHDFEWLIVDDGSTDNTRKIIESYAKIASFPIRYVYQNNGHKKTAFNHGVRLAEGELFLPADSDDAFPADALEIFSKHWFDIAKEERPNFVGVCGLCQDESGKIVGDKFPGDWGIDSNSLELRYKYKVNGEKWGFSRTEVLRSHPFPEDIPGHVPESVVWAAIATQYKTRFINRVVRIYYQGDDQLTKTGNPAKDAYGAIYYKGQMLSHELNYFLYKPQHFLLEAARWTRFRLHVGKNKMGLSYWPLKAFGRALIVLMSPLGFSWWLFDRMKKFNKK